MHTLTHTSDTLHHFIGYHTDAIHGSTSSIDQTHSASNLDHVFERTSHIDSHVEVGFSGHCDTHHGCHGEASLQIDVHFGR